MLICPYCGSEFTVSSEETDGYKSDDPINKDWFYYEWQYDKLLNYNNDCREVVSSFVRVYSWLSFDKRRPLSSRNPRR